MPELDVSRLVNFAREIDYTSLDWLAFLSDMAGDIPRLTPEWTDTNPTDPGMVLLELLAFALDGLSYRLDVLAQESFLQTAVLRKSVLSHARMLDYTPKPPTSAMVELLLSVSPQALDFTIPAGTRFATASTPTEEAISFESLEEVEVPTGATEITLTAIQGETREELLGSSSGLSNQFFELSHRPLVYLPTGESSLDVLVVENGVTTQWSEVRTLLDAGPGERAYAITTDEDDVVTVNFGDGGLGRIPVAGVDNLRARYRTGVGRKGNVGANTITQMVSNLPQVLSVTNPASATGGSDRESVDSIKRQAPRNLRTLWRAVTAEDYKTLAEGLPGVAKATVVCGGAGEGHFFGQVNVYIVPEGGGLPSEDLKSQVETFLGEREMLNAVTVARDPVYVPIVISLQVTVKEEYLREDTRARVQRALESFLDQAGVDFGMAVYESDVLGLSRGLEGVHHADLLFLHRQDAAPGVANVILAKKEVPVLDILTVTAVGGVA